MMVRWIGGWMDRWIGGSVGRWIGGSVDRWIGGPQVVRVGVGYNRYPWGYV